MVPSFYVDFVRELGLFPYSILKDIGHFFRHFTPQIRLRQNGRIYHTSHNAFSIFSIHGRVIQHFFLPSGVPFKLRPPTITCAIYGDYINDGSTLVPHRPQYPPMDYYRDRTPQHTAPSPTRTTDFKQPMPYQYNDTYHPRSILHPN